MPLYEYKCGSCGNVFEVIQKFSDQPLTVHENCGGPLERLISTSALQFKGSGWYVNDYGKGNSKVPNSAQSDGKGEKSNGSHAPAESSGKSEKSEKSTKSESAPSTASTSTSSKSDSKKSESK